MQDERTQDSRNPWMEQDGHTAAVLECVFSWLCGNELSRAGAVCHAWHRAASAPALWRHLLSTHRQARPTALRVLARHFADRDYDPEWSWRDEYIRAAAGWARVGTLRPPPATPQPEEAGQLQALDLNERNVGGAILLHAALNSRGDALAVASDDATVTVWKKVGDPAWAWRATWRMSLRRRGWQSVARVHWAPEPLPGEDERLLVAGPLALADRWELLVLELSDDCESGRVLARTSCGAGAAGCWATRDTFLSLELRLLAPRRAVTTIWLNAATQEAQSEFTGVSTPVLRIYNEAQAHLTHVAVAEIAKIEELDKLASLGSEARYMRVTLDVNWEKSGRRVMVAGCGEEGGVGGVVTALGCWALAALRVPPLYAAEGGGLAERVARRRRTPRVEDPEPPPPTEDELRALCSPPGAILSLQARLLGLVLHPGGRCLWATDASGRATCAALPTLEILRVLTSAPADPTSRPHYVQPAVSKWLLVSPVGSDSSWVRAWSALSGATVALPAPASAPILAALLPPPSPHTPLSLLLLAGDAIHADCAKSPTKFTRKPAAKTQAGSDESTVGCARSAVGCLKPAADKPPVECYKPPECVKQPKEPCPPAVCDRSPVECLESPGKCSTPPLKKQRSGKVKTMKVCEEIPVGCINCEDASNCVTRKLHAEERARRADYMREVCEREPPEVPCTPPYKLVGRSECLGATDGRNYTIKGSVPPKKSCGPCREPPPPCCVELVPDNKCQRHDNKGHTLDPCAHRPKTFIRIDRLNQSVKPEIAEGITSSTSGGPRTSTRPNPPAAKPTGPSTAAAKICAIVKSLTRGNKTDSCTQTTQAGNQNSNAPSATKNNSSRGTQGGMAKQAGDSSWCETMNPPPAASPRCRPIGADEKIRRRPCPDIPCGPRASASRRRPTEKRYLHTAVACYAPEPTSSKADQSKLDAMLLERAKLKDAAQGRVVQVQEKCKKSESEVVTGCLELPVPQGASSVNVNVSVNPKPLCKSPSTDGCKTDAPKASKLANSATAASSTAANKPAHAKSKAASVSRAVPSEDEPKSWLSLRNLQRKISRSCRKSDSFVSVHRNKVKSSTSKPRCAPRSSPCVPSKPKDCPCACKQKDSPCTCISKDSPCTCKPKDCPSPPKPKNSTSTFKAGLNPCAPKPKAPVEKKTRSSSPCPGSKTSPCSSDNKPSSPAKKSSPCSTSADKVKFSGNCSTPYPTTTCKSSSSAKHTPSKPKSTCYTPIFYTIFPQVT